MTSVVLDASALLAVMNAEPGAEIVRATLPESVISAVNYSEVLKKTIERCITTGPVIALVHGYSVEVVPFDEAHAVAAAELYPESKAHGMSFADRACLSLGVLRRSTVVTAERKMKLVTLPIKVKLIRNAN